MNGLCTGLSRRDGTLSLELQNEGGTLLHHLVVGQEITFEAVGDKVCIGYRRPGDNKPIACPESVVGLKRPQCEDCLRAAAILPCHLCTGERCNNPARRDSCVQPDNHITYLASFAPGVFKVGVAREGRRQARLIEQGARAAIIIACDDGQQVRRVETQIKRHIRCRQHTRDGVSDALIPDRLAPTSKLWAYTQTATSQQDGETVEEWQTRDNKIMHKQLLEIFESSVKPRIIGKWLDSPQIVDLPVLVPLEVVPRLMPVKAGDKVRGMIEGIYGQTMVMALDTGETVAMDAGALVGFKLRPLEDFEYGQGQMMLTMF